MLHTHTNPSRSTRENKKIIKRGLKGLRERTFGVDWDTVLGVVWWKRKDSGKWAWFFSSNYSIGGMGMNSFLVELKKAIWIPSQANLEHISLFLIFKFYFALLPKLKSPFNFRRLISMFWLAGCWGALAPVTT